MLPLFDRYTTLRAVIESVLEGRLGAIVPADGAARLDLGCYAILGGEAAAAGSEGLVRGIEPPREILVPPDQGWRDLLVRVFSDRLEDRPMRTFSSHALDRERLAGLARVVAEGYSLRPLDLDLARQLDDGIVPHGLQVFDSPEHLVSDGLGRCVVDGAGQLAAAATSYAISSRRVEIALATREAHRGRGLGSAAAAALVLDCLDRGLHPEWSAANPVSKRLALRLGYRPAALCDVFYLPG